jgi:hypothetical protein
MTSTLLLHKLCVSEGTNLICTLPVARTTTVQNGLSHPTITNIGTICNHPPTSAHTSRAESSTRGVSVSLFVFSARMSGGNKTGEANTYAA